MLSAALTAAFTALGIVIMLVRQVRVLKRSLVTALNETAEHQIRTTQKLADAITTLQKQQKLYEQQLLAIAQAGQKLREDITIVARHIDRSRGDEAETTGQRVLH